jgi:hypothetical protein
LLQKELRHYTNTIELETGISDIHQNIKNECNADISSAHLIVAEKLIESKNIDSMIAEASFNVDNSKIGDISGISSQDKKYKLDEIISANQIEVEKSNNVSMKSPEFFKSMTSNIDSMIAGASFKVDNGKIGDTSGISNQYKPKSDQCRTESKNNVLNRSLENSFNRLTSDIDSMIADASSMTPAMEKNNTEIKKPAKISTKNSNDSINNGEILLDKEDGEITPKLKNAGGSIWLW